jgi:hypothetical protein
MLDARGSDRAMRVTWHHDIGIVVLSLWRGETCVGTFRLPREAVPGLIDALVSGLAEGHKPGTTTTSAVSA